MVCPRDGNEEDGSLENVLKDDTSPVVLYGVRRNRLGEGDAEDRASDKQHVAPEECYCVLREHGSESEIERCALGLYAGDVRPDGEDEHGYPKEGEETLRGRSVRREVQGDTTARTRNSLAPLSSLVVSKADLRGVKVIRARSFLEDLERKGLET